MRSWSTSNASDGSDGLLLRRPLSLPLALLSIVLAGERFETAHYQIALYVDDLVQESELVERQAHRFKAWAGNR